MQLSPTNGSWASSTRNGMLQGSSIDEISKVETLALAEGSWITLCGLQRARAEDCTCVDGPPLWQIFHVNLTHSRCCVAWRTQDACCAYGEVPCPPSLRNSFRLTGVHWPHRNPHVPHQRTFRVTPCHRSPRFSINRLPTYTLPGFDASSTTLESAA